MTDDDWTALARLAAELKIFREEAVSCLRQLDELQPRLAALAEMAASIAIAEMAASITIPKGEVGENDRG